MTVVRTRAILFRAHAYSETSQVLRLYTEELGLVGVMARGVRRQASRGRGALDTFGEGVAVISYRHTRELQTLREFSPQLVRTGLGRDLARLGGASVLAEIVLRHAGQEPHPALFESLSRSLDRLAEAEPADLLPIFLRQAWQVVTLLGFAPVLDACTRCGRPLASDEMAVFDLGSGGVRCSRCSAGPDARRIGPVARAQLRALVEDTETDEVRKPQAHLSLLDDFVTFHMLGGRRLQSFQFLEGHRHDGE